MVGILFYDNAYCAVLDAELLSKDVIEFTQNSWMGDYFEPELRNAIKDYLGEENV